MKQPFIDVIIAVYNGAPYIQEAIASVQAQTYPNFRILVADDGSTDNTLDLVKKLSQEDPRITVLHYPHRGVSATINSAVSASSSPYVAFLDADDLFHNQKLEKQMQALLDNEASIVFCLLQEFESLNELEKPTHRARTRPLKGYSKIAFLGKREVFDTYGLFDEQVAIGDFVDWFARVVRAKAPVTMVEEVLAYRRIHANNTTRTAPKTAFLSLLKMHLDEKRRKTE